MTRSLLSLVAVAWLLLLFSTTPIATLSAQIELRQRLELEVGTNFVFNARPKGRFAKNPYQTKGGLGYQLGANLHLLQKRVGKDSLRVSFLLGINYGRSSFDLEGLNYEEQGELLSAEGGVITGAYQSTAGTANVWEESIRTQLQVRIETGRKLALIAGFQFLTLRAGRAELRETDTATHFYDATRGVYVPRLVPELTERKQLTRRTNPMRFQFGAEYRDFLGSAYAKLLIESGFRGGSYPYSTGHLSFLLGYRI